MCGFVGFIDFSFQSSELILRSMNDSINHRGPDDSGIVYNRNDLFEIGLGHKRLSILDLSSAGHQPMIYENLKIVYNGEIYNFKEIKKELVELGHSFISNTDTEVILHAYLEWGQTCVTKFIGMFAFVVYDEIENKLLLFRDRVGVKPLYYYWNEDLLLFSSELKSFHTHPSFKKSINKPALRVFFELGYIPGTASIFDHVFKLEAGTILEFDLIKRSHQISKYWDVSEFYKKDKIDINYTEAKNKVHDLLISSYNYRLISDVPVGVFLSGGYDSASVAAILKNSLNSQSLKTFTIGFDEGNNEAPFAKSISNYLGTDHHEWICTSKIAQEKVLKLPYFFDEPFADSSAIPTMLLSNYVKSHVAVSLSADGGDEIFGGYKVYNTFLRRYSQLDSIPKSARKNIELFSKWLLKNFEFKNERIRHSIYVFSNVFKNDLINSGYLYKSYSVRNKAELDSLLKENSISASSSFDLDFSQYNDLMSIPLTVDTKTYLCDDILTKVDRSTMAASLEGREPLLDHRLIEFVAQIPSSFKSEKKILKDIVHEYIPKKIMDRPKTGFSIPLESWLKKDLKFLIYEYLDTNSISKTGLFNLDFAEKIKNEFLNNSNKHVDLIWKLIQFQMWYKKWIDND
jgi:asparagine synthase (glutamine-hydrolysing)